MQKVFSTIVISTFAGVGSLPYLIAGNRAQEKVASPNVIIVLTDDQGYGDLSIHGNPVLKTPVLDKLHNQSIRFTDFHVAPMSSPTRGQLMTGRDAMDNGATVVNRGRSLVREELPTMANIFKASGYQTAQFGKWHLGESYPYRPQDRGFDETVHFKGAQLTGPPDYFGNSLWNDTYEHNGRWEKFNGYCTDVWFNLSLNYLKNWKRGEKPFFLYLATNSPHAPHLCDEKYSNPYLEKGMTQQVSKFFGQIANIDENMQRLLTTLDETGLTENTILIYMTDNGSVAGSAVFNAGMRGQKKDYWEGGHRVPLFIRWPNGNLGKPRDIDELTQCQDILPTLIDLCQLKKTENAEFDGVSLAPLLLGKTKKIGDRMLIVEYGPKHNPEVNNAVLWNKWRLIGSNKLYDLTTDPHQDNDVAGKYPEVVIAMQNHLKEWWIKTSPEFAKKRNIHIGSDKANPTVLYASDCQVSDFDKGMLGNFQFGSWEIQVETPGRYEISLYRAHPESGLALDQPSPGIWKTFTTTPVAGARLRIGDFDKTINTSKGQTSAKFTVVLNAGTTKIDTWLLDKNGNELYVALFLKAELLK
jgi:arylsulfatase A-like enzyme